MVATYSSQFNISESPLEFRLFCNTAGIRQVVKRNPRTNVTISSGHDHWFFNPTGFGNMYHAATTGEMDVAPGNVGKTISRADNTKVHYSRFQESSVYATLISFLNKMGLKRSFNITKYGTGLVEDRANAGVRKSIEGGDTLTTHYRFGRLITAKARGYDTRYLSALIDTLAHETVHLKGMSGSVAGELGVSMVLQELSNYVSKELKGAGRVYGKERERLLELMYEIKKIQKERESTIPEVYGGRNLEKIVSSLKEEARRKRVKNVREYVSRELEKRYGEGSRTSSTSSNNESNGDTNYSNDNTAEYTADNDNTSSSGNRKKKGKKEKTAKERSYGNNDAHSKKSNNKKRANKRSSAKKGK